MSVPAPGGVIAGVRPGSLAEEAGIAPGDRILEIAGRVPRDVIDLQFYQADAEVEVRIGRAGGGEELLLFEKDPDEDLGLEFDAATWDGITLCNNNCFFCFLKGLPRGMRRPLYLKDDDYRLSFLHGNFVTLTNLSEDDWARLAEQRLSPLNVSVHATDLALRRRMLGNQAAPDVVGQIERLGSLGITVNAQVVLCPGVNDGRQLENTLAELAALHPVVETVAVVPVGASPRLEDVALARDGVSLARPGPEGARETVALVRRFQNECRAKWGESVVHASDELYLAAGNAVPPSSHYDGFRQYENGVGMVRTLLGDWKRTRRRLQRGNGPGPLAVANLTVACGTLIAPVMEGVAAEFAAASGVRTGVTPILNTVFGERVNVSGLVCGRDFREQLAGRNTACFVLPRTSLDYFGERFLDGETPETLAAALGAPVAFASQWSEVLEIAARGPQAPRPNAALNGAAWSEPRLRRRAAGRTSAYRPR